jgi:hypothetical protein
MVKDDAHDGAWVVKAVRLLGIMAHLGVPTISRTDLKASQVLGSLWTTSPEREP